MTVEVKVEETQVGEVVAQEEPKKVVSCENEKVVAEGDEKVKEVEESEAKPESVEKSSSYKEESNYLSDLKEFEKKALSELKLKLEEAILGNSIFKKEEPKKAEEKKTEGEVKTEEKAEEVKTEEKKETPDETVKTEENPEEVKPEETEEVCEKKTEEVAEAPAAEEKETAAGEGEEEKKIENDFEVDKEIALWGVPLFPGKGLESTDVVLLKFLRAREFKVNEAFEMLKKTLQWRKESKIDSILDEEVCADLSPAAYLNGVDREGHPVCYNIFGVFDNEELYQKAFGSEEKRGQFLRWRLQLMEKSVQKLELRPGGATSLLQIIDLKNSPGPAKKELRIATKQAVGLLQDNYPELVAKNIFINVPFWFYAFNAILSPFLTQRTRSKFVVARPAKVTETLLKYITAQEIPTQYGGFKKEDDTEFSAGDVDVSELFLKAGGTGTIQIDAAEVNTLVWDVTILGGDVYYKEEFVPTDEGSYTIIVQKRKKLGSNEGPIRNTFRCNEPGKVVLTIENNSSKKKKKVLYRYKSKKCSTI